MNDHIHPYAIEEDTDILVVGSDKDNPPGSQQGSS